MSTLRAVAARVAAHPVLAFWIFFALFPFIVPNRTMATQVLIFGLLAMGFNLLYGYTGLLSFGHAAYYGLGAFATLHLMKAVEGHLVTWPTPLLPLAGAVVGLFFGLVFGWLATQRTGVYFAMVTLALAELLFTLAPTWTSLFGGESGISTMRMNSWAIDFATDTGVYYLTLVWVVVSTWCLWAFTRTPMGRLALAVRENEHRVRFLGFNTHGAKTLIFALSTMFTGVAGALLAIANEATNYTIFSAQASANVVLQTFIGGAGTFFGPLNESFPLLTVKSAIGIVCEKSPKSSCTLVIAASTRMHSSPSRKTSTAMSSALTVEGLSSAVGSGEPPEAIAALPQSDQRALRDILARAVEILRAELLEGLRGDPGVGAVGAVDDDSQRGEVRSEALDDVLEVAVGRDPDLIDLTLGAGKGRIEEGLDLLLGGVRQLLSFAIEELDPVVLGRVVGGRDDRAQIEREERDRRSRQHTGENGVAAGSHDAPRKGLLELGARRAGDGEDLRERVARHGAHSFVPKTMRSRRPESRHTF